MDVAERILAAWNEHNPNAVAELYTEDGIREEFVITRARAEGRQNIAEQVAMYMTAMPDLRLEARHVDQSPGGVTIEWTLTGHHQGDAEGWPAKGEPVLLHGSTTLDLAGGLVREERVYADFAILLAGAGLIPGMDAPGS
jgi:steroid delta-isomerase-like uncharacterized protein